LSSTRLILAASAIALAAPVSFGAEGVLPVRAGDRVNGEVRWCGDRHVLAVELVKGETFKAKVRVGRALLEDITVRVYDPTGLSLNSEHVRTNASIARVGPFRATESGTHLIQLTTFTRHEIPYDVTTQVRSKKRRAMRLKEGRAKTFVAPAGAVLRLRGVKDGGTVALGLPGEAAEALPADGFCLRALLGDGLTLPVGGTYTLQALEGAGRPRAIVKAPAKKLRREVAFPELPDDRGAVATWYDDTGWVADPLLEAPADHEPPVSVPDPNAPPADPIEGRTLTEAPSAPPTADARDDFSVEDPLGGHLAGLGMPIAPVPTIEQALVLGAQESFGDGPSYVFEQAVPGIGTVTYRVQFLVAGRAALAPLSLDGRTSMRWWVEGDGAFHEESWTLTVDPDRGVEVLDGSATYIGAGFETVQSAAAAYTLPVDGRAPSGVLTWGVESAANGAFLRTETHDGRGGVGVTIR
jgi:hypothetical protein